MERSQVFDGVRYLVFLFADFSLKTEKACECRRICFFNIQNIQINFKKLLTTQGVI